ncbi:MAG: LysR family transcriptional regulator [Candidatus Leucobacter sulfamidivorax]|nr:LysR family transcriptional regulator [Candidatus Leucobacter sulfamidivorax]
MDANQTNLWQDLSLRQLAHFVAVAEEGTIRAAAQRLFMSQSAISNSITELERTLGLGLCVRRRSQGVSLTPTGRQVLAQAKQVLGEAAKLGMMSRGEGSELAGPLRVGCFVTLTPTVLPRLLVEYTSRHPLVAMSFVEGSQEVLQDRLLSGDLDIAIMYDLDLKTDPERAVLYEPRAYALFGEGHPFAELPSVSLERLAPEPLVLVDAAPSTSYAMSLFGAQGLRPNIRLLTQSYEFSRSIVARDSSCYGMLVQRPVNTSSYEGLPIIEREITPLPPPCPVVLAWSKDTRLSPPAAEFVTLARRLYADAGADRGSHDAS